MNHLGPFLVNFDKCQFLATPALFEYFCQNWVFSENRFFSMNENKASIRLEVLGGQVLTLYSDTIFGGVQHLGGPAGHQKQRFCFDTFVTV